MDTTLVVVLLVAVVAIAVAGWMYFQKQRTERLSERFGPEYGRTVSELGDRRQAESALEAREKRVAGLDIRPLPPAERTRFSESWHSVQARFVDDPAGAVTDADTLVAEVMQARGYPVGDFEQRAADVSVDHPAVVDNFRAAHEIAGRNTRGEASTEDLRKAMVYYRALFDDLLETTTTEVRR